MGRHAGAVGRALYDGEVCLAAGGDRVQAID